VFVGTWFRILHHFDVVSMSLDKRKKSAVGKINGLTRVTPATIVYTVAQVRIYFSLAQSTQIC
jgi:hypothetical protein